MLLREGCSYKMMAHPNGREQGEGIYVSATDNLKQKRGGLREFIATNVLSTGELTAESLQRSMDLMLWSV